MAEPSGDPAIRDPHAYQTGFDFARFWVDHLAMPGQALYIYAALASNHPQWPLLDRIPQTPMGEGFALGVYGIKALEGISGTT